MMMDESSLAKPLASATVMMYWPEGRAVRSIFGASERKVPFATTVLSVVVTV